MAIHTWLHLDYCFKYSGLIAVFTFESNLITYLTLSPPLSLLRLIKTFDNNGVNSSSDVEIASLDKWCHDCGVVIKHCG